LTSVNIQPRAEAEADEAAAWYELEQPGLGIEFLLELDAAIERATENPLAYARGLRHPSSTACQFALAIESASLAHNNGLHRTAASRNGG
jgi:plasmid stabilization system protein ParE